MPVSYCSVIVRDDQRGISHAETGGRMQRTHLSWIFQGWSSSCISILGDDRLKKTRWGRNYTALFRDEAKPSVALGTETL